MIFRAGPPKLWKNVTYGNAILSSWSTNNFSHTSNRRPVSLLSLGKLMYAMNILDDVWEEKGYQIHFTLIYACCNKQYRKTSWFLMLIIFPRPAISSGSILYEFYYKLMWEIHCGVWNKVSNAFSGYMSSGKFGMSSNDLLPPKNDIGVKFY